MQAEESLSKAGIQDRMKGTIPFFSKGTERNEERGHSLLRTLQYPPQHSEGAGVVWLSVGFGSVYGRRGRPRLGGCAGSVSGATVAGLSRSMLTLSSRWPKSRWKIFGSREITPYGPSYRTVSGV